METKVQNWVCRKSCDCITKSNKSDEHAFCTVCSVDISVAHGGRQYITMPPCSSLIIHADLPNFTVVRLASLLYLQLAQTVAQIPRHLTTIHMMTMTSFAITRCGQCCRCHVVQQQVVSDISIVCSRWWPTGLLQCFDIVGLVIWPVIIVPKRTCDVLSATLTLHYLVNNPINDPIPIMFGPKGTDPQ